MPGKRDASALQGHLPGQMSGKSQVGVLIPCAFGLTISARNRERRNEMSQKGFKQVYDETQALCKTATDGGPNSDTTLWDWMWEGYWKTMTPAQMAAEWDALSEA
jgi:hypothetical protein